MIIPLTRSLRCIALCSLIPNNPLLAITTSEIISYCYPIINESQDLSNIILFSFHYFYYHESSKYIMLDYVYKYKKMYILELIFLICYILY